MSCNGRSQDDVEATGCRGSATARRAGNRAKGSLTTDKATLTDRQKMGFEAQKTNRTRSAEFVRTYLAGDVLDIGCGPDLVLPSAKPFDFEHGDANRILDYLQPESFDCVHSSHCLEHMRDVPAALAQWWKLVKRGGYMVLVVPDEDLYEQGHWPSLFNTDHKATFRLDKADSWSPVSYDLRRLVAALPDCEILEIAVQDTGYDRSLLRLPRGPLAPLFRHWQRCLVWFQHRRRGVLYRLGIKSRRFESTWDRIERLLGKPSAQTDGDALAQIQAVLLRREQ